MGANTTESSSKIPQNFPNECNQPIFEKTRIITPSAFQIAEDINFGDDCLNLKYDNYQFDCKCFKIPKLEINKYTENRLKIQKSIKNFIDDTTFYLPYSDETKKIKITRAGKKLFKEIECLIVEMKLILKLYTGYVGQIPQYDYFNSTYENSFLNPIDAYAHIKKNCLKNKNLNPEFTNVIENLLRNIKILPDDQFSENDIKRPLPKYLIDTINSAIVTYNKTAETHFMRKNYIRNLAKYDKLLDNLKSVIKKEVLPTIRQTLALFNELSNKLPKGEQEKLKFQLDIECKKNFKISGVDSYEKLPEVMKQMLSEFSHVAKYGKFANEYEEANKKQKDCLVSIFDTLQALTNENSNGFDRSLTVETAKSNVDYYAIICNKLTYKINNEVDKETVHNGRAKLSKLMESISHNKKRLEQSNNDLIKMTSGTKFRFKQILNFCLNHINIILLLIGIVRGIII